MIIQHVDCPRILSFNIFQPQIYLHVFCLYYSEITLQIIVQTYSFSHCVGVFEFM